MVIVDELGRPVAVRAGGCASLWPGARAWIQTDATVLSQGQPLPQTPAGVALSMDRDPIALQIGAETLSIDVDAPEPSSLHARWAAILAELDAHWPGGAVLGSPESWARMALVLVPGWLRAVRRAVAAPGRRGVSMSMPIPMHAVRRADRSVVSALARQPGAVAALGGWHPPDIREPTLLQWRAAPGWDHPANRALVWMMRRLEAAFEHTADQLADHPTRAALLRRAATHSAQIRAQSPLAHVRPAPPTPEALLTMIDDPHYARAHTLARRLLSPRLSPGGEGQSLFESWVALRVLALLRAATPDWRWSAPSTGPWWRAARSQGETLEIWRGPVFEPVDTASVGYARGSLSVRGRASLAVARRRDGEGSWVCVEARDESAPVGEDVRGRVHWLRDALWWGACGGRCAGAAAVSLEAPVAPGSWSSPQFRETFGLGIFRLAPDGGESAALSRWMLRCLGLLIVLLAGCRPAPKVTPEPPKPVESMAWWSEGTPIEAPDDLKALPRSEALWSVPGTPVVSLSGDVLVEHLWRLGEVRGVSLADGRELWRIGAPPSVRKPSAPLVLDGGVVVLKTPAWLTAVDIETARIVWESGPWWFQRRKMDTEMRATVWGPDLLLLVPAKGAAISGSADKPSQRDVVLMEGRTGREKWRRPCGGVRCEVLWVEEGQVALRRGERELALFDAEGNEIESDELEMAFGDMAMVLPGGLALWKEGDRLEAVDLLDMTELWSTQTTGLKTAVPLGDWLLLVEGRNVRAVSLEDGRDVWSVAVSEEIAARFERPRGWSALEGGHALLQAGYLTPGMGASLLVDGASGRVSLRAQGLRIEQVFPLGERALLVSKQRWSLVRWTNTGAPRRAEETLDEDIARSLRLLHQRAVSDAAPEPFPAHFLQAREWLMRLGPAQYRTALLGVWESATWAQIPALVELISALPEEDRLRLLRTRLARTYGATSTVELAKARAAILGAFRIHPPDPDSSVLASETLAWLKAEAPGGIDRVRAMGAPRVVEGEEAPLAEAVRDHRRASEVLFSTRQAMGGLSMASDEGGRPTFLDTIRQIGHAPICPWPRPLTYKSPKQRDALTAQATCAMTEPPPDARYDPTRTWAVWRSDALDLATELWVLRKVKGRWVGPLLTGIHNRAEWPAWISSEPDTLVLHWSKTEETRLDWPELSKDRDGDGWTDKLEARLGTRPDAADTDGDGQPDPIDPNPGCAPGPLSDEDAARWAVLWHLRGLETAPQPLFMRAGGGSCLQIETLGGAMVTVPPDVLDALRKSAGPGAVGVLKIQPPKPLEPQTAGLDELERGEPTWDRAPSAMVTFTISRGPFDERVQRVLVRKIDGQWRVVGPWPWRAGRSGR